MRPSTLAVLLALPSARALPSGAVNDVTGGLLDWISRSVEQSNCVAISAKVNDNWCKKMCSSGDCPLDRCKCGDVLRDLPKDPSEISPSHSPRKTGEHAPTATKKTGDTVVRYPPETPEEEEDVAPNQTTPVQPKSQRVKHASTKPQHASTKPQHASTKPQHQILQTDCVAISDSVNDYWCQSMCPSGQCPVDMCTCGHGVPSREKTPSHRLSTKKTGRHRLHASTLKHKILPRDRTRSSFTSAAFVSRLREYRAEHATLPSSMLQRYYNEEFMERLREYREDHGDVDLCTFADGIQVGDGMTKSEFESIGQGTCKCPTAHSPERGCYWSVLSGEGGSMQVEVRDKATFCSEIENEDCGGCPMPTNYISDCTCPVECESGGPQSDTASFCASSECVSGCPGLMAVEHSDCTCPDSCMSAMAEDFGTDKYLSTVWAQCNRHDDACDNCDECANFDPHCPASCGAKKLSGGHANECAPPEEMNEIQRLHADPNSDDCSSCDFCHGCPEWCGGARPNYRLTPPPPPRPSPNPNPHPNPHPNPNPNQVRRASHRLPGRCARAVEGPRLRAVRAVPVGVQSRALRPVPFAVPFAVAVAVAVALALALGLMG